jgi:hypothetical protein
MEYLHQSTYGHVGGFHTAKPIMAMDRDKGHIYDIKNGKADLAKPIFAIRGDHVYATAFHPNGASPHAMFEIRGDKLHTTVNHPAHNSAAHIYELKSHL